MSKSWDCFMDSFVNVVMPDDYCPDDNPMPLVEKALEEFRKRLEQGDCNLTWEICEEEVSDE